MFGELLDELLQVPGAIYCCVADGAMGKVLASSGGADQDGANVHLAVLGWGATAEGYLAAAAHDELDDLIVTTRRAYHLVRELRVVPATVGLPATGPAAGEPRRGPALAGDRPTPRRRRPSASPTSRNACSAGTRAGPERSGDEAHTGSAAGRQRAGGVAPPAPGGSVAEPTTPPPRPARGAASGPDTGVGPAAPTHRGAAALDGDPAPRSRSAARTQAALGRRRSHDETPALGPAAAPINDRSTTEYNIDSNTAVRM